MKVFDPYTYDLATTATPPALAEDALLEAPAALRGALWHGLLDAVADAVDLWERTPSARRYVPPMLVHHTGKRRFAPAYLQAQTLAGWHRLVGIESGLAVEALEALALGEDTAERRAVLAEECARVGQLYAEMERRAGEWVALALVRWGLRLLRYRASPLLAPFVYN